MRPALQRRVQRYGWDRAAGFYDDGWSAQLAPAHEATLELAGLRPGEQVLDVACGTGLVSLPAARAVAPGGRVLATDISDGMLERARRRAEAEALSNIAFARADAEALEQAIGHSGAGRTAAGATSDRSAGFDAALCALGLMYAPDPIRALAEMGRALRPGGRAVAAVWGERSACGWAEIFPIVDRRVHTDVCPLFFGLGAGDALEDALRRAGFESVRSRRIRTVLEYASGEEAVGAAFAGGPVAMAYARFDHGTQREAQAEYLDSIAPFRNGAGYRIPGEFVVVRGERPGGTGGDDRR